MTQIQIIEIGSNNISAPSLVLIHSTGLMKNSNEWHLSLFSTAEKLFFTRRKMKNVYSKIWLLAISNNLVLEYRTGMYSGYSTERFFPSLLWGKRLDSNICPGHLDTWRQLRASDGAKDDDPQPRFIISSVINPAAFSWNLMRWRRVLLPSSRLHRRPRSHQAPSSI